MGIAMNQFVEFIKAIYFKLRSLMLITEYNLKIRCFL